jgi:hypothetical protein
MSHTVPSSETRVPTPLPTDGTQHRFNTADRNRDGWLNPDEYKTTPWQPDPYFRQTFQLADLNRNNKLEFEEFAREVNTRQAQAAASFKALDTNRDQRVSFGELMVSPFWGVPKEPSVRAFLELYDVDPKDGVLSPKELHVAIQKGVNPMPAQAQPPSKLAGKMAPTPGSKRL